YYKLKYESVFSNMEDLQQTLPAKTSLVRYIFINNELFVIVIDKITKRLFSLQSNELERSVSELTRYSSNFTHTSEILKELYDKLWAPFASLVKNQKVIIVPDGILFSLNFEILTPSRISGYSELATNSLLAKHTISYH